MAKQLNISMKFTADTSQAKAQVQELQKQITDAMNATSKSNLPLTDKIQSAVSAAAQLKAQLTAATNVNTGNLDLSKFSESLKNSKTSLKSYAKQLIELGPAGEQAFMSLARSVVSAEVPMKRTNALLNEMFTTLKNTAKWQISSSVLHGFMGALQSAYGYAQDLNESLNNIRIVTNATVNDMVKFATEANKAAKALSATTTDYTNASLIYYQQGLNDQQVKERTDITIKMANVARQSAEIVSDQMTAVWNNFNDGSKSLEYYADVMTALGAATASSTDEIATGLEKFAAISETVGLSYEYATAALATVTDKTRQSAEVVGTAFKTMFARIEGLELGETLEDGTTLNQYSDALAKVGVNIKDSNGELKDMDNILKEMAAIWETLNRDEQVALAQKVAGVRQYNQLMSLMENWDAMEINLNVVAQSDGALQEQADIYAESWEASRDRVTAAAENIYTKLIDEDFFIRVNNLLEDVLTGFGKIIDVAGGLPGILTAIGAVLTRVFGNQLTTSINNLVHNFRVFTGAAEDMANKTRKEMKDAIDIFNSGLEKNSASAFEGEVLKREIDLTYNLQEKVSSLTEEQKAYYQELIKIETQYGKNAVAAKQAAEMASQSQGDISRKLRSKIVDSTASKSSDEQESSMAHFTDGQAEMDKAVQSAVNISKTIQSAFTTRMSGETIFKQLKVSMEKFNKETVDNSKSLTTINKALSEYEKIIKKSEVSTEKKAQATKQLKQALKNLGLEEQIIDDIIQSEAESLKKENAELPITTDNWRNYGNARRKVIEAEDAAKVAESNYQKRIEETNKSLKQGEIAAQSYGQAFTKASQGITSLMFGLNSLKSIFDTLNNQDLSGFEKITTVMSQLSIAIPSIISGLSGLVGAIQTVNEAKKAGSVSILAYLLGLKAENLVNEKGEKIILRKALAKKLETQSTNQNTVAKTVNYAITKLLNLETLAFYSTLLLIVAVLAAVAAGIYLLVNRYNEAENAAKRASEQAKIAAEQYEKIKEKYDDLKKSLEDYQNAKDALNHLTEGTDEWKESIVKANEEAQKLIDTYDELQGKYSYNTETKLIEFEKGALEDLEKNQKTIVNNQYINKITASNSEKIAQNRASITNASRENDPSYWDNFKGIVGYGASLGVAASMGITAASGGTALVPILAGVLLAALEAGGRTLYQRSNNDEQQEALSNLADQYIESDGNFTAALENLSQEDRKLIDSLGFTTDELKSLCSELAGNTLAIRENNKAIIDNMFTGNKAYDENLNKKFLNQYLGDNFELEKDIVQKEIDSWSKKVIREEYAKAQGYTVVESKGDATVYADEAGETVTIGNEVAKSYLVQQEALKSLSKDLENTSKKINALVIEEKKLAEQYGDSVQTFEEYKEKLKESATNLGFSEDEIEDYIYKYGTNVRGAKKNTVSKNLTNLGYDKNQIQIMVDNMSKNLSNEELDLVVTASADAKSLDDFSRKFEESLSQSFLNSIEASLSELDIILEDNEVSVSEAILLEDNENFIAYLEEQGKSMVDVTRASYTERQAIVNGFYNELKRLEQEGLEFIKNNYQEDLIEYQAILDYKLAKERGDSTSTTAIQNQYSNINFEAYLDMDTSEIDSQLDRIQEKINEISEQQIKLAIEWDGIEELENSYKKAGEFAQTIENDMEVVGDSYQMTAAAAREWMEVYPELFKNAEVTENGLIELNKIKVDDYINGQDAIIDANVDAKIAKLKNEKEELLAKKKAVEIDLELARTKAAGEMELEHASAEYLTTLRKKLVEYYINLGQTEEEAHNNALKSMGLSQNEFTKLVAEASAKTSVSLQTSAIEASESWEQKFGRVFGNLKNLFGELTTNISRLLKGQSIEWNFVWEKPISGTQTATTNITQQGVDVDDYNFDTETKNPISLEDAALDSVTNDLVEIYEKQLEEIDKGITSIENQITYAEALKNQDLSDFGKTNIDKDKDEEKIKQLEEEIERYHEINEELDDLNRNLNKVSKAKDKAFGKKKLALIDQEIAATEELIDATQRYINEAETHFNNDAARLNAFGAQYDEQGRIVNYDEMYSRELSLYNAAQATGDEAIIEAAEKRYEDFKKVLENYEESLNTLEEQEDQLQDYVDQIADLKLAKIEYEIELNVELNQADLDNIEYQLSMLGDKAFDEAIELSLLEQKAARYEAQGKAYSDGVSSLLSQKGLSNSQIESIQNGNTSALSGIEFTANEIELIKNSIKGMQDSNVALVELNKQIGELLPASFEAWNEKIDENLEKFEYYDSVGEHFKNIIDIVGQKPLGISGGFLKEMELVSVANQKNEIEALSEVLKGLEEERKIAEEKLSKATTDADKTYWENMLTQIQSREAEIQNRILESTEQALKKITDIYTKEIQNSLDKFEKQISGSFENLEKLQDSYDKQKKLKDSYVADYKKLYELNKISRQIEKDINNTDSVKNKKLLQELQDEINEAQKSGTKLSEYDLEVLKKKYDLKVAEAALDEAKNAKSQVKLVRNQEGNYNYVYTADEGEVDNAIQNYEDKLFELQDLNENYIEEMSAAFIQVQTEMVDELAKIQLQDFESYADYKKAVDETVAYYQERMSYYSEELQKGLDNNNKLYENEYQVCLEANKGKYESYDTFTTKFEDTLLGRLQSSYSSISEYQAAVNSAIYGNNPSNPEGLLGDLHSGYEQWRDLTDDVLETAGGDMEDFAGVVAYSLVGKDADSVSSVLNISGENFDELRGAVSDYVYGSNGLNSSIESWRNKVWGSVYGSAGVINSSNDTKDAIEDLTIEAVEDFEDISWQVEDWQERWEASFQAAIDKTDELIDAYGNLIDALSAHQSIPNLEKTIRIVTEEVNKQSYTGSQSSSESQNPATNNSYVPTQNKQKTLTGDGVLKAGDKVMGVNGKGMMSYYQTGGGQWQKDDYVVYASADSPAKVLTHEASGFKMVEIDTRNQGTLVKITHNGNIAYVKKSDLTGYDTGGYTGAWGSEGKLAMLHEKEIVLNKEDTSNMLQAVNILREISNVLDLQAGQASVATLQANGLSLLLNNNQDRQIEQTVQIYAEFPDATDHLELQEAFNNLINTASQYVNRNY